MLFKGNSSRLELLIGKIHAHKEPSQDEQHKSKGLYRCNFLSFRIFLFLVAFPLYLHFIYLISIYVYPKFCYFSMKFDIIVVFFYVISQLFIRHRRTLADSREIFHSLNLQKFD